MTTLPGAILKLIPPGSNDPGIIPVGVVLHRAVSSASSLHDYFDGPSGGIESHNYYRLDGSREQYRDFEHEADAQGAGNSWIGPDGRRYGFISWETQDKLPDGTLVKEWTPEQCASMRADLKWLSAKFGFPLRIVTTPQPTSAAKGGVGWHELFPSWNVNKHDCPGAAREAQVPSLLTEEDLPITDAEFARFAQIVADNNPASATVDWTRFAVHAPDGDLSLQAALGRMLAQLSTLVANDVDLKATIERVASAQGVVDPQRLADAVISEMGQKLSPPPAA